LDKYEEEAKIDAKRNALRSEDITKVVFVTVSHLPKAKLKKSADGVLLL